MIALATMHGRYGARSLVALFNHDVPSAHAPNMIFNGRRSGKRLHGCHRSWPSISSDHLAINIIRSIWLSRNATLSFKYFLGATLITFLVGVSIPQSG